MEMIQMIFIFFFSGDLADGATLVRFIALPMILLNSVGTFIFMSILTTTLKQEEQAKAVQTHDVLELAAETLPYFREGLNKNSSKKVAEIIKHYTKVSAHDKQSSNFSSCWRRKRSSYSRARSHYGAFSGSVTDGPNDHRTCQRRSWLFGP